MESSIDREKVINGLREISCMATWKDIDRIRHKFQPIINDAIAMLKEQEPVKPEVYYVSQDKYKFYRCPVCKIAWYYKGNYCLGCGRAVKWE